MTEFLRWFVGLQMGRHSLAKLFFSDALGTSGRSGDRVFPVFDTNGVDLSVLNRIAATYLADIELG